MTFNGGGAVPGPPHEVVVVLCPECGRVELEPKEIRLCVRVDDHANGTPKGGRGFYGLRCPQCGEYFTRDAGFRAANLLIGVGAPVFTWKAPGELTEQHPDGPPIALDDLIDFHFELERVLA